MKEFVIGERQAGQRSDKYLKKILSNASTGFLYKMMRKKNIVLNGRKMTGKEILQKNDRVRIYFSDETFTKMAGFQDVPTVANALPEDQNHGKITVIYEDKDLLILNKPAGILSQKAHSNDYSVNDWLIHYLMESGQMRQEDLIDFRPSIANRLDRNTSGLILAGKTVHGLQMLGQALKDRTIQKYYRTIVAGVLYDSQNLDGYLLRDANTNQVRVVEKPQKNASRIQTSYRPKVRFNGFTELEVHLITGKTHQIRAHLASVHHPVIGDRKYGDSRINRLWKKRCGLCNQLLHAYRMVLPDGREFCAPLPPQYKAVLEELNKRK